MWKETEAVRTPHATCSLVRTEKRNILIDPGLPGPALVARLYERTGLKPDAIDTIFLTNARPAHRAAVGAFRKAKVLLHELEQQATLAQLRELLDETEDAEDRTPIANEIEIIESYRAAEDQLAPQVDLFPLFGYTAGTCGLLVSGAIQTTLIAGDAVATQDHLLAGQVLPGCFNLEQAKESLREVYEIADIVVPGHDNVFPSPRGFSGR